MCAYRTEWDSTFEYPRIASGTRSRNAEFVTYFGTRDSEKAREPNFSHRIPTRYRNHCRRRRHQHHYYCRFLRPSSRSACVYYYLLHFVLFCVPWKHCNAIFGQLKAMQCYIRQVPSIGIQCSRRRFRTSQNGAHGSSCNNMNHFFFSNGSRKPTHPRAYTHISERKLVRLIEVIDERRSKTQRRE